MTWKGQDVKCQNTSQNNVMFLFLSRFDLNNGTVDLLTLFSCVEGRTDRNGFTKWQFLATSVVISVYHTQCSKEHTLPLLHTQCSKEHTLPLLHDRQTLDTKAYIHFFQIKDDQLHQNEMTNLSISHSFCVQLYQWVLGLRYRGGRQQAVKAP